VPKTRIVYYQEASGDCPVVSWLKALKARNFKAWVKCRARVEQLSLSGHQLRRPSADYLRDGIYELRAKHLHVQFRILYFFHGQDVAILAHAITKAGNAVEFAEIERMILRRDLFIKNPTKHSYQMGEL
jgi:hypothetical protein